MRTRTKLLAVVAAAVAPVLLAALPADAATTTVALWNMDSAPMTDSSGSGNDGALTDVSVVPGGVSGNAYSFAGSNSHVTVPNAASLNPGAADFSVTAHVRFSSPPSSTTGDYDLIRKGLSSAICGEWKMEIFPGGGLTSPAYCLFKDSTKKVASIRGTKNLADGSWHTLTCTKTSTQVSLTVDGATRSVSTSLGSIGNSADLVVGQKLGGGDQYAGDMDEVSIDLGSAPSGGGGGGGGDATAPTWKSGTPANNATSIGLAANVTATFSEKVQNVGSSTFTVAPSSGGATVAAAYSSNTAGTKWILNPSVNLAKDTWYTVTLTSGITDTSGNALAAAPVTWQFLTGPAPKLSSKSPTAGATGVSTGTTVTATFNEPVQNVSPTTFTLSSGAGSVAATVVRSGTTNKWILTPGARLQSGTTYTATVLGGPGGITDLAGNPLKTVTWSFTTG